MYIVLQISDRTKFKNYNCKMMLVEQWIQELEIMRDEDDGSLPDITEKIKSEIDDMNERMTTINDFKKMFTKSKIRVDQYVHQKVDST